MIKNSDRFAVAVAGPLLALALIYFAVPQGLSALSALPASREADNLSKGIEQGPEELRKLAGSRAEALNWGGNPQYARELSSAYYSMIRWVAPENRRSLIAATRNATVAELQVRPLNALAWWRLVVLDDYRTGTASRQSARYLARSVEDQPNAMTLMPHRLGSIIYNWWLFDTGERQKISAQFLKTWRRDPGSVVKLAENKAISGIVRGALATDPLVAGAFEDALQRKMR